MDPVGKRRLLLALGALLALSSMPVNAQQATARPIMPGGYSIPAFVKPVTLRPVFRPEPLLRAAREIAANAARVQRQESVLFVTDSSVSPVLNQAIERALRERSDRVRVAVLDAPPATGTAGRIALQQWEDWWPADVWAAAADADAIVAAAYVSPEVLERALSSNGRAPRDRRFVSITAVPELLADPGALYPKELLDLMQRKIQVRMQGASVLRIRDGAGTDLVVTPQSIASETAPSFPYNPAIVIRPDNRTAGVLVAHSTSGGFVPLLHAGIQASQVTSIEGGGEVGELMRQVPALQIERVQWHLHPKSVRSQAELAGSAAIHNQLSGAGRAGAVQIRLGSVGTRRWFDLQVFYPTVTADGEVLIREGYPMVLEDTEVVRLAESLGGVELLTVQCTVLPGRTPEPRSPALPAVTSVDALVPALKNMARDIAKLRAGEKVLIVTDSSVPALVEQALMAALEGIGVTVSRYTEEAPKAEQEPVALLGQVAARVISEDLKQAMTAADCILSPAYYSLPDVRVDGKDLDAWLESVGKRWIGIAAVPEILASKWAAYPAELLDLIGHKVEQTLQSESTIILSSNQGTSVIYDYDLERGGGKRWSVFPVSPEFRLRSKRRDVEGVIVTSNLVTGAVSRLELTIGESAVVAAEGSSLLRAAVQAATASGGFVELSFGIHPKAFPVPAEASGFSPHLWSRHSAAMRSGIVTVLLGSFAAQNPSLPLEILYPSLNAGGQKIVVDVGRLRALDDPEVQALAERLGSGQDLLTEDWIPAVGAR